MEHFEQEPVGEAPVEIKKEQERFLEMETELLRRAGCTPEDNRKCEEWIGKYAGNLRSIVSSNTAILEQWGANPEAVLAEIEEKLYARERMEK